MDNNKRISNIYRKIDKSFILKILLCLFLSFVVIFIFFMFNKVIDKKQSRKYEIKNDIMFMNQIEDINIEANKIEINGYAFLLDMNSDNSEISILLRNVNNEKEIWAEVEQKNRTDVATFFSKEYNYGNSGFVAIIKESKLKEDECYEIIVKLDYLEADKDENKVSKTVSTNRYIVNGKLYSYNPVEFEHPNIESDLLIEVFNNGQLCFYQKDRGLYVYQYNSQLYWISDENFNFDADGMTSIPCNVYTSWHDKLPENRIKNGFENRGFNFKEYEYKNEDIAPYRVAIWNILDEYPISFIKTGEYDSGWIWSKSFHINYIFE